MTLYGLTLFEEVCRVVRIKIIVCNAIITNNDSVCIAEYLFSKILCADKRKAYFRTEPDSLFI